MKVKESPSIEIWGVALWWSQESRRLFHFK